MSFIRFAMRTMPHWETIVLVSLLAVLAVVYVGSAWILLRGAIRMWSSRPASERPRWRRICRGTLLSLAAAGVLCAAYAYFIEPYWPEVCEYTVATSKLPKGAQPIRIVHISDTHCDLKVRLEDRLPQMIADLKPDIIVFTGDAVNSDEGLPNFRRLMGNLAVIAPTYAVRGNWDWPAYSNIDLYAGTGVTELVKRVQPVKIRDTTLYLVGVAWADWEVAVPLQKIPPPGVVSATPFSNFHFGSGLRSPRNWDRSLPSKSTKASDGGPPTGPGSTTGGS